MTDPAAADPLLETRRRILAAALPNVPFDGWSDALLAQAIADAGVDRAEARLAFPRAVDLAIFHHREGDRRLAEAMRAEDLGRLRVRERVTWAVWRRLEIADEAREAVRRATALFALPQHAADGARLIWETADTIWTTLGDPSDDLNWWTKRGILAGVYGSTALYWLGDDSAEHERTRAFLDRRIEGVMRFEKAKAAVNANPLGRLLMTGPNWLAARIRKPGGAVDTGTPVDLPGGR